MAYMAHSNCISCGTFFSYNPHSVPSIRVRRVAGKLVEDPAGEREPICRCCIERANPIRAKNGLPPIDILPDAYEPVEEDGDIIPDPYGLG